MQKNGLFKRVGRARQDKSVSCIPEPLLLARILQLTKHTTTHRRGLHSVQVFAEKMGQEDPLGNMDRFSTSPCWTTIQAREKKIRVDRIEKTMIPLW